GGVEPGRVDPPGARQPAPRAEGKRRPRRNHCRRGELPERSARRWRAGEEPSVDEYAERHPQWADEIREVLPAVVMMEQLKPRRDDAPTLAEPGAPPTRVPERVGEFRIIREIGRGGMGVVVEAVQESL